MYHRRVLGPDLRLELLGICSEPGVKNGIRFSSVSAYSHMFSCSSFGSWSKRLCGLVACWSCGRLFPCIVSGDDIRSCRSLLTRKSIRRITHAINISKGKTTSSDSRRKDGGLGGESGARMWLVMRWRRVSAHPSEAELRESGVCFVDSGCRVFVRASTLSTGDIAYLISHQNKNYPRDQSGTYATA
jgi:hypothetical protein